MSQIFQIESLNFLQQHADDPGSKSSRLFIGPLFAGPHLCTGAMRCCSVLKFRVALKVDQDRVDYVIFSATRAYFILPAFLLEQLGTTQLLINVDTCGGLIRMSASNAGIRVQECHSPSWILKRQFSIGNFQKKTVDYR